jgi:glycogen(starch) synthase
MSLRVFYMAGPGDVAGTFRHWREGRDDPSEVARTYSGQFFDLCRELDLRAHVVAFAPQRTSAGDGRILVEHRPIPWAKASGVRFHLGRVLYGLQMLALAWKFRARVLVVSGGTPWVVVSLFALLGIRVVPALHCVLWPKYRPLRASERILRRLSRPLFSRVAHGILSLSADIDRQLRELAAGRPRPAVPFLPSYRRASFDGLPERPPAAPPFRVLFAGRIERNKGVFDLLEIARRLRADGRTDIEFDLCGKGGALEELRARAAELGVAATFRCHGHCTRDRMRGFFSEAHVVVAPTTTDFEEGFNKVVAEGVLAGRPVITSSVCPALDYVRDAVVEVPPDDVDAYRRAILELCDRPEALEARRSACRAAREPFYDPARGWGAALRKVLAGLIAPGNGRRAGTR